MTSNDEKIAVVTGAAGGMGAAAVVRLAAAGWPLLLCDLDAGRLAPIAAEFLAGGRSAQILAGDIADASYPARLTAALGAREIGVFIHTAGLSPTSPSRPISRGCRESSRRIRGRASLSHFG